MSLPQVPVPPKAVVPIVNAVVLGFTAGLCEEWARYLAFRHVLKSRRERTDGVVFGLSHGGIESVLLAVLVALGAINMIVMHYVEPAALGVPPEQLAAVQTAVDAWWAMDWYMPLLSAAERLMAITLHVAATLLVLYGVATRRLWPVFAAMGWHWLADAVIVWLAGQHGIVASELAVFVLTLGSAAIAVAVWRAFPMPIENPTPPPEQPLANEAGLV
jgi:uncharacterized membrane protein YhfC